MRNKQTKQVRANLYQTSKELQAVLSQYPTAAIPEFIPEHNAGAFNFVGLRIKQGLGISTELQVQTFTKEVNVWESMSDDQKKPHIMGAFQQVIMIHNPYMKTQEETKTEPKQERLPQTRLTKAKKAQINKLLEKGEGADDDGLALIAEKVGVTFEQLKEYIQSF